MTRWDPEPTLTLSLGLLWFWQRCPGKLPTLGTVVQPSLPSACHSLSTDGAKHLGVSVTLCPCRLRGTLCLRCPQTIPELLMCGEEAVPQPLPLRFLPSEHRCSCLNRTYFQDDSWGGCGWGASPTLRARLGWNLPALLALGFGAFPSGGASPGLLSGGTVPAGPPAAVSLCALWGISSQPTASPDEAGGWEPARSAQCIHEMFHFLFSRAVASGATS